MRNKIYREGRCAGPKYILRKRGLPALVVLCVVVPYFIVAFPLAFFVQRAMPAFLLPRKMWECELAFLFMSLLFVIMLALADAYCFDKIIGANLSLETLLINMWP